jgi:hypothetical protein
MTGLLGPRDQN